MFSRSDSEGRNLRCTLPAETRLSEAIGHYLLLREQDGLRLSTLSLFRQAAWSLVEFLQADPLIGSLNGDTAVDWLQWLRKTPWGLRRRGAYPTQFTPDSVTAFLIAPPKSYSSGKLRGEPTIGRLWRCGRPLLEWLGLPVRLPRKQRPRLRLPPPWVPTRDAIAERWRDLWAGKAGTADRTARRRVILVQGLVLCTRMRIEECLTAERERMEGHWLLIADSKTHQPRIVYLSRQALGIVEALRPAGQLTMAWAPERLHRVSGWPYTKGRWHRLTQACGLAGKVQQELRQRMATWLRALIFRKGLDPAIESAQLGHGSGVVIEHYLDYLRRLPRLLERFKLPAIEGFEWPAPIEAQRALPGRLYEEFRQIVQAGTG